MASKKLIYQIQKEYCRNDETKRRFVPDGALDGCIDDGTARNILESLEFEPFENKSALEAVMNGGRRVFAILITINEAKSMLDFIANDPLQSQSLDSRLPYTRENLNFLDGPIADEFYERQWGFAAPVLTRQFHHRKLDEATILPFIESRLLGSGGFGTVYKVRVQRNHQKLQPHLYNKVCH